LKRLSKEFIGLSHSKKKIDETNSSLTQARREEIDNSKVFFGALIELCELSIYRESLQLIRERLKGRDNSSQIM